MARYEWRSALEPIIKHAGKILLSYRGKRLEQRFKYARGGLVTQADIASEAYLTKELSRLIPDCSFIAEESGRSVGNGDCTWIIDPLDGTTNFAHGLPYFCVSVGLEQDGKLIAGAIYNPMMNEFFYAEAGKGAQCNGQPIKISRAKSLKDALLVCGLPYRRRKNRTQTIELTQKIAYKSYALRYPGAVAMDLANLAAGRFDGALYAGVAWWDVAAGIVIASEAGAQAVNFSGEHIRKGPTSCIVAKPGIVKELLKIVQESDGLI